MPSVGLSDVSNTQSVGASPLLRTASSLDKGDSMAAQYTIVSCGDVGRSRGGGCFGLIIAGVSSLPFCFHSFSHLFLYSKTQKDTVDEAMSREPEVEVPEKYHRQSLT